MNLSLRLLTGLWWRELEINSHFIADGGAHTANEADADVSDRVHSPLTVSQSVSVGVSVKKPINYLFRHFRLRRESNRRRLLRCVVRLEYQWLSSLPSDPSDSFGAENRSRSRSSSLFFACLVNKTFCK